MKFRSNKGWQALALAALLTVPAVSLTAQEERRNKEGRNVSASASQVYVVSAKAGGIGYAVGGVRVTRDNTGMTQILAKGDHLGDKDQISVDANGKAEILLNPGSYLRLAENTELRMIDTALESLKLKLNSGSALIEAVDVGDDDGATVTMQTPHTNIQLEKSGIYRVNANADNTEIYVWRGAATVAGETIKGGRKTVIGKSGAVAAAAAKFDKDEERDALDIWSKSRAKELAKLNDRLEQREIERAFRSSSLNAFSGFQRRGFWVLNRSTGAYCFLPFGFDYWDSPYGFGFRRSIFWGYGYRPVMVYPRRTMPETIGTMPAPSRPGATAAPSPATAIPAPSTASPGVDRPRVPGIIRRKGSPIE